MAAGHSRKQANALPVQPLNAALYLPFTPENENGVVFVFALVAKRLGFEVKKVQRPFPDCLATWGRRRVRIEFEFRSRNFDAHHHDARRCDVIVCWQHDWPGLPAGIEVVELRKLFGLGWDAWVVAYGDAWPGLPSNRRPSTLWSVPSKAGPDDALLVYRPGEYGREGAITDVFRVHTPVERVKNPGWRTEPDWMATIQRVAKLGKPIPYPRMRQLGIAGGIEARPRVTDRWAEVYKELLRAKPSHSLSRFSG